jgi:hypothetical protein
VLFCAPAPESTPRNAPFRFETPYLLYKRRAQGHDFPMKPLLPVLLSLLLAVSVHAQKKPAPADTPVSDAAAVAAAHKNIIAKLNKIIIPKIEFREATVRECIAFLHQKSVELDPAPDVARRGVGIDSKTDPEPAGTLPPGFTPAPGGAVVSPDDTKISLSLTNIPLGDAIHYIAFLGGMKAGFDSHGLLFEPLAAGQGLKDDPLNPSFNGGNNRAMTAKLDRIIIPEIEIREASLDQVIAFLRQKSIELDALEKDPAKKGVNIFFKPGDPGTKFIFSLTNIPLGEALSCVARTAGCKLIIDPHAVVLEPVTKAK